MGGVTLSLEESLDVVNKWRRMYGEIATGWKTCHDALRKIADGVEHAIDPWGLCWTCKEGIRTPKGMIRYPNLRQALSDRDTDRNGNPKKEWVYGFGRHKKKVYAGLVTENIVQHLARCVIADHAVIVKKELGLSPALMVHDELVYVVDAGNAEETLAAVQKIMRSGVTWWEELRCWSEGDVADTYGSAK
jgi:DNA polymerase